MTDPNPCLQFYFSKPRFAALLVGFLGPIDCLNLRLVCERFRAMLDELPDEVFPARKIQLLQWRPCDLQGSDLPLQLNRSEPFQVGRCLACKARRETSLLFPLYQTYTHGGEGLISKYPLDPEKHSGPTDPTRFNIVDVWSVTLPRPAGHVKCPDCRDHIRAQLVQARMERSSCGLALVPFPPHCSPILSEIQD